MHAVSKSDGKEEETMSVFGSIFGKNRSGKGSHDVAFTAGAHSPRPRPGRSVRSETVFPMAAQSETEHHIGGAPTRAPSPQGCQTGRSMIEMLGVLAIVGVLVAGAVAAYTFAAAKNRANSIYRQVDLRAVASVGNPVVRQTLPGQEYTCSDSMKQSATSPIDIKKQMRPDSILLSALFQSACVDACRIWLFHCQKQFS